MGLIKEKKHGFDSHEFRSELTEFLRCGMASPGPPLGQGRIHRSVKKRPPIPSLHSVSFAISVLHHFLTCVPWSMPARFLHVAQFFYVWLVKSQFFGPFFVGETHRFPCPNVLSRFQYGKKQLLWHFLPLQITDFGHFNTFSSAGAATRCQVQSPARLPKIVSFNTAPRQVEITRWDEYPLAKKMI